MTIIDKIKEPAAILKYHPKPDFITDYDKQKYYEKEKEKWLNGYKDIPGTLYHKTQEQKIKNRYTGEIIHPICRDADLWVHQEIDSCRKNGEALLIIKGRGFGLSSEMGCLSNYFMRVYPGSTCLFTSSEQAKISTLFSEKVMTTFNEYDDDIKPKIANKNETKNAVYLKLEVKYWKDNGTIGHNYSQIFAKETSDSIQSASGFSGQGAIFGAYDELYLHKRRKKLLDSSSSCYIDQATGEVIGFLLAGGTIENILKNEEILELQTLISQTQKYNRLGTLKARLLFIPDWWGKFMLNGHSNEKKAKEKWEKEIAEIEKIGDKESLRSYKMNHPMSLSDIFDLTVSGRWEDDVAEKIRIQTIKIKESEIREEKGRMSELGMNIQFNPTEKKGIITILEQPKINVNYYLCIDGVATGRTTGEEKGSNVAGVVVKMFDNNGLCYAPVCIYYERPSNIEQSYINLVNQAKYYNKYDGMKGIMAEANVGTADHFSSFLNKAGLKKWIINRKDLSGKGYSNTLKPFQYVNIDVRDWQMRQANIFLRKNIEQIRMIDLLNQMMLPETENADILDAWLMWFIAVPQDYDKPFEIKKQTIRQVRKIVTDEHGKTKVIWE